MTDQTKIDSNQLRTIADAIGSIAQDSSAFTKLQGQNPSAGRFDAARWLNDIFADRRNALYQHGMDLKQTFHDMSIHLHNIADEYDNADTGNAEGLAKLESGISEEMSTMKSQITGDVSNPVQGPHTGQDYTSGDQTNPDGHHSTVTLHGDGTATVTDTDGHKHHVESTHDSPNEYKVS